MESVPTKKLPVSIWCYVALLLGGATWALLAFFIVLWPSLNQERVGIFAIPLFGMPGAIVCSWTVPKDPKDRAGLWRIAMWLNYAWPLLIAVLLFVSTIGRIF